jgi:hypothetical protein
MKEEMNPNGPGGNAPRKPIMKRRREIEEFQFPPLTVTWKQCEDAWDATGKQTPLGKIYTAGDLIDSPAGPLEEAFFRERLVYDPELDVLHVRFFYDYEVDTERITEPIHLLRWVLHLCGKTWMNMHFIKEFAKKVCAIKGWNPYGA